MGDKDCERLRRDINVPVNKPLEAKDAQDKVALMDREAPRELMIFSEEARIMAFSRGPEPDQKFSSCRWFGPSQRFR